MTGETNPDNSNKDGSDASTTAIREAHTVDRVVGSPSLEAERRVTHGEGEALGDRAAPSPGPAPGSSEAAAAVQPQQECDAPAAASVAASVALAAASAASVGREVGTASGSASGGNNSSTNNNGVNSGTNANANAEQPSVDISSTSSFTVNDVASENNIDAPRKKPVITFDSTTKSQTFTNKKSSVTISSNQANNGSSADINSIKDQFEQENPRVMAISNLRCPSPPPILKPNQSQQQFIATNSIGSVSTNSIADVIPGVSNSTNNPVTNDFKPIKLDSTNTHVVSPQPQSILVQSNPCSPSSIKPHFISPPKSPVPSIVSQQQQQRERERERETIPAGGALLRGRAAAQAVVSAAAAHAAREKSSSKLAELFDEERQSNDDRELSVRNLKLNQQQFHHQKLPSMHAHFYVDDTLKHGGSSGESRSRSGSASTCESRNVPVPIDTALNSINDRDSRRSASNLHGPASIVGVAATGGGPGVAGPAGGGGGPAASTNAQSSNGVATGHPTSVASPVTKQIIDARLPQDDNKFHVLFGICGSVSTKKTRLIINKLEEIFGRKISIQLILTSAAEHFVSRGEFPTNVQIWRDKDEWSTWGARSDPVLHIELRRWADILIIAPLTANTLSKIALGLCDNLLTNVVRAWNTQYPILLAPSMVSYAYNSPTTKRHLKAIKEEMKWIEILKPTEKVVGSYGDIGMGGMMDWNEIVNTVCLKAKKLGFNEESEPEEDEEESEEDDENNDDEDEEEDKSDEDEDEDEEELIKLSVAEEDELEKVLKK